MSFGCDHASGLAAALDCRRRALARCACPRRSDEGDLLKITLRPSLPAVVDGDRSRLPV